MNQGPNVERTDVEQTRVERQGDCGRIAASRALQVVVDLRRDEHIVVTNQGSARLWPKLCNHPLDFHYNPSAMGGGIPLALGLALAQPRREVIMISGDGSLLMNLGCLVTVIDCDVDNLTIVVLDNGLYEVTGGQKTPGCRSHTDFAGIARSVGFPNVVQFQRLADWQRDAPRVFSQSGPRFVWLEVAAVSEGYDAERPCSMSQQLTRFRTALGT